jgi:hypothetical protein
MGVPRNEGCDFHPGSGLTTTADPDNGMLLFDNGRYQTPYMVGEFAEYKTLSSAYDAALNDPNVFTNGVSIFLQPGCYQLPCDMTQSSKADNIPAKVHFQGVSRTNANVMVFGQTQSIGNKSWHGICFMEDKRKGGNYRLENCETYKKHPNFVDRFCKCELSQNFRFEVRNQKLAFKGCLFDYGHLTRDLKPGENAILETSPDDGAFQFEECRFEVCRLSSGPRTFMYLQSNTCPGQNDTLIKNCSSNLIIGGQTDFYFIRIEGTQPVYIDGHHHVNTKVNPETTLIGSPKFSPGINLCITNSTFVGEESHNGTFLANLWTNKTPAEQVDIGPIQVFSTRITKMQTARYDAFPDEKKSHYSHNGKGKEPEHEAGPPPGEASNAILLHTCNIVPPKDRVNPGIEIDVDQRVKVGFNIRLFKTNVEASSERAFILFTQAGDDTEAQTIFSLVTTGNTFTNIGGNPPWLRANMRSGSILNVNTDETNGRVDVQGRKYEKLVQEGDDVLTITQIEKDIV